MATTGIKSCQLKLGRLKELLDYDPVTGEFAWKVFRNGKAKAGSIAGTPDSYGYLQIKIDWRLYLAHRLAWFYVHGEWPLRIVDHRDNDKTNNALSNLRLATDAESAHNAGLSKRNTSGFKGVYWRKDNRTWGACITVDRKRLHLGLFADINEANAVVVAARHNLHGEFARVA